MSNYKWEKYNIKNMKLAKKFISLNKKNKYVASLKNKSSTFSLNLVFNK